MQLQSTQNLTCLQCHYPLHTLALEGSCPECGTSVALSAKPRGLAALSPKLLLHTACALYLWSFVIALRALLSAIAFAVITYRLVPVATMESNDEPFADTLAVYTGLASMAAAGWVTWRMASPRLLEHFPSPRWNLTLPFMGLWFCAFCGRALLTGTRISPAVMNPFFPAWAYTPSVFIWNLFNIAIILLAVRLAWLGEKKRLGWALVVLAVLMLTLILAKYFNQPYLLAVGSPTIHDPGVIRYLVLTTSIILQLFALALAFLLLANVFMRARASRIDPSPPAGQ